MIAHRQNPPCAPNPTRRRKGHLRMPHSLAPPDDDADADFASDDAPLVATDSAYGKAPPPPKESKPAFWLVCACVLAAFTAGITIVLQTALSVVLADLSKVWPFSLCLSVHCCLLFCSLLFGPCSLFSGLHFAFCLLLFAIFNLLSLSLSLFSAPCSLFSALCSLLSALCSLLSALCSFSPSPFSHPPFSSPHPCGFSDSGVSNR